MTTVSLIAGVFEVPASVLNWLYTLTGSYMSAISLSAFVVMAIVTPLTLKSTKGMLEMQRLAPEMRRLQQQYKTDRQKLNEEMMSSTRSTRSTQWPHVFRCSHKHQCSS